MCVARRIDYRVVCPCFVGAEDPTRYTWSDGHSDVWGLDGIGPASYGTGGYPVYLLGMNLSQATAVVQQLFNDRYLRCVRVPGVADP